MTFTSDQMEFSVLPYTPYELEQAAHIHELPVPYQTVIMINSRQMGVGGDNTWGARTHEEYLLTRQAHHLSFTEKPVESDRLFYCMNASMIVMI